MSDNAVNYDYKLPHKQEGHRNFFHLNSADWWNFYSYFVSTHDGINKFKNFNNIRAEYISSLKKEH